MAFIFSTVVYIRNLCYQYNIFKSYKIPINSFCVGNVTVGGTGKTPMTDYIVQLLSSKQKLAVLSRGYGRKTTGFIEVENQHDASSVGDEPLLLFNKNHNKAHFFVCEDRVLGYKKIMDRVKIDCIILDDALQHKSIKAKKNFILINFHQPVHKDFFLPLGRLREHRSGLKNADCIIVTKCPKELSVEEKKKMIRGLNTYISSKIPVFFSSLEYGHLTNLENENINIKGYKVLLITGIAFAKPLVQYVKNNFQLVEHLHLKDHQEYNKSTLGTIKASIQKHKKKDAKICVITTEKDYVRMGKHLENGKLTNVKAFYIPIKINMGEEKVKFDNFILKSVS